MSSNEKAGFLNQIFEDYARRLSWAGRQSKNALSISHGIHCSELANELHEAIGVKGKKLTNNILKQVQQEKMLRLPGDERIGQRLKFSASTVALLTKSFSFVDTLNPEDVGRFQAQITA